MTQDRQAIEFEAAYLQEFVLLLIEVSTMIQGGVSALPKMDELIAALVRDGKPDPIMQKIVTAMSVLAHVQPKMEEIMRLVHGRVSVLEQAAEE